MHALEVHSALVVLFDIYFRCIRNRSLYIVTKDNQNYIISCRNLFSIILQTASSAYKQQLQFFGYKKHIQLFFTQEFVFTFEYGAEERFHRRNLLALIPFQQKKPEKLFQLP